MSKTKKNTTNTLSSLSVFSSYTERILKENRFAKIHSVFPNGFNLNFNGDLVYVSYHQKGMLSATGLAIDRDVFDQIKPHIQPNLRVRLRDDQLTFYTRPYVFTVQLTDKEKKNLKAVPVTADELKSFEFSTRLEKLKVIEHSGFSDDERLETILKNVLNKRKITDEHINKLIGAGIGLTPTGDDFLQGVILMEQTLNHPPQIQSMTEEQLEKRSTTQVSTSYYRALFEGYSNEPLVLLFEAVKAQNDKQFKEAIGYIQNYGSTSGYDLLTGMQTYLQII